MRLTASETNPRWLQERPNVENAGKSVEVYVGEAFGSEYVEYRMHLGNESPRSRRWMITVVQPHTGMSVTVFGASNYQREATAEAIARLSNLVSGARQSEEAA
jgi:hypothetical protein